MATGITLAEFLNNDDIVIEPTSMQFLQARMLEEAGQYREALEIYRTVLEKRKLDFGEMHLETMKTKYRMARILYILDEYKEALPMFEDVYSRTKVMYGPEDGDGLLARGYLANILRKTGKDALAIYEAIYKIQSKKWPQKSFTLTTRINIALELCDQGRYEESLKVFDEISKMQLEIKSEDLWSILEKKSFVLCKQGNFSEALDNAKSLYENKKLYVGENHPEAIKALKCIGIILAEKREYDQAASTMKAVIQQLKPNEKIEILQNKWFLALILKKYGKLDESLSLFNELYAIMKGKPRETITLLTSKLLVKILDQQGKYDEALRLYKEVEKMDKPGSPDYLITVKNIKRITDQLGNCNKSGSSPNELYEIESQNLWKIWEDCEKHVAEYI